MYADSGDHDVLFGGSENDTMFGGAHITMTTGSGNALVVSKGGNDTIFGGTGQSFTISDFKLGTDSLEFGNDSDNAIARKKWSTDPPRSS